MRETYCVVVSTKDLSACIVSLGRSASASTELPEHIGTHDILAVVFGDSATQHSTLTAFSFNAPLLMRYTTTSSS